MRSEKSDDIPEEEKNQIIEVNNKSGSVFNEKNVESVSILQPVNQEPKETNTNINDSNPIKEKAILQDPVILDVEKEPEVMRKDQEIKENVSDPSSGIFVGKPLQPDANLENLEPKEKQNFLNKVLSLKNKAKETVVGNQKSILASIAVSGVALASYFLIKRKKN